MKLAPSAITSCPARAPSAASDLVSDWVKVKLRPPSTPPASLMSLIAIFADLDGGPSYWFIQPLSAMAKPMTISSSAAWLGVATPSDRASAAAPASNVIFRIVVSSLYGRTLVFYSAVTRRHCGIRKQL